MAKRRIEISAEDMRRIARYEITFRDLVPEGNFMGVEFVCAGRYETTLEDLREALARMRESDPPLWELYSDWFGPLQRLADNFGLNRFDDDEKNDAETSEFPGLKTTEGEYFSDLLQALRYACEGFEDDEEEDDEEEDEDEGWRLSQELNLNARINQIDRFLENRSKPLDEWRFSSDEKERYVRQFESDAFQAKASEPALALARKFVEELCEEDSTLALHIKGYSCYGGNRLYPTDWRASRDCITRLFEKTNDPGYANTLGYIYYYGRCSDGVPDYDAAFRYFEIAALNNVDEAIYKLGDMFRHGYGCRKSERTAWELYSRAYDENLDAFLQGKNASFADAALRMGLVFSEGINASIDCELALEFLLEAEYAAKIRVKESDFFGYAKVVANVEKKLAEVRDQLPDDFFQDEVGYYYPRFFDSLASDNHRCELARYASAEGRVALVVKRIPTRSVPHPKAILVAVPELAFCERTNLVSLTLDEDAEVWFKDDAICVRYDFCKFNYPDGRYYFYYDDELVAWTKSKRYHFHGAKNETYGPEYRFAVVRFSPDGKTYDYFCDDAAVQPGDRVIVEGYDGEKEVEVVETTTRRESELVLPFARYKNVLRKA